MVVVPFSRSSWRNTRHLPAGRSRAGDRHLKIHDYRDNFVGSSSAPSTAEAHGDVSITPSSPTRRGRAHGSSPKPICVVSVRSTALLRHVPCSTHPPPGRACDGGDRCLKPPVVGSPHTTPRRVRCGNYRRSRASTRRHAYCWVIVTSPNRPAGQGLRASAVASAIARAAWTPLASPFSKSLSVIAMVFVM
jgi:hypothetical protein